MIRLGREDLQDITVATDREWLETNGIGGFASSTVTGMNTRRYHALLIAALRPPTGRAALLSRVEETLIVDGQRYELSSNQYSGTVHPRGFGYLESFRLDPFPISTFLVEGVRVEKSFFLVHGKNTAVLQYRVRGSRGRSVQLEVRPLIAFRDYHSLTRENDSLDRTVRIEDEQSLSIHPYGDLPELHLSHNAFEVKAEGYWYRNFEYIRERERGLDFVEDLFNPLTLHFTLTQRQPAAIIASTERTPIDVVEELRSAEVRRREEVVAGAGSQDFLIRTLTAAADHYVAGRGHQKTIIAGYPWFTDWGRDTMIALPGLTLVTGRDDVTRSVLREFAKHVDMGMLPNRFPDSGETPEYNTIDATLWYFEAVRSLIEHTGDYRFVHTELYPVLREIVAWHIRGTRYGIRMDDDGLLGSEDPGVQLTWMDAKIGDWVITPRTGKAVEIQALWYNALRTMEDLAEATGDGVEAERFRGVGDRARQSFNRLFWNEEANCLFDVVRGEERDTSIRPNQILVVSLAHSILDEDKAKAVVDTVERELFTPYGLRSLARNDDRYRGRYEGDVVARDSAYHQGPVWPWLLGPFIEAYIKVRGQGRPTQKQVRIWLEQIADHLKQAGLGHISEILDGDAPHHPRGCFAQAWSVAEILRVAVQFSRRRKNVHHHRACNTARAPQTIAQVGHSN